VALNGSGQAACTYAPTSEGTHVISASYDGDANFAPSSGMVTQFVDNATVQSGSTFCNNGTITLNQVGNAQPGSPYPQHVFVSGLTGSLTGVTMTLQNVNAYLGSFEALLVGPACDKFVALSKAGSTASKFTGNLVLSDSAGQNVTISTTSPQGSNGTRYTFTGWSDGSTSASHQITVSVSKTSYTANFSTAYLLTTQVNSTTEGSVTVNTASPTNNGYYGPNTQVSVTATPSSSTYKFLNWSANPALSSTTTATTTVTMSGPEMITANFGSNNVSVTLNTSPQRPAGQRR
jgi:Divergent InlB B-repeat domain